MATTQYGVTDKGFVRKPLSDILESLNNKMTGEFGTDFDVSPESPDGQVIGIIADEIDQCWNQAQQVFNSYRPGAVSGVGLDNVCELNNIKRYVDRHSRVTVYCDGSSGVRVPAGSIVSDGNMNFELDTDVTLPGDVTAVAVSSGEYYVAPNTVNKVVTEISGWTSVNNDEVGETGVMYESDPSMRARRDRTTAINGSASVEAIYAALADLNLSYIRIRDNDTGKYIGSQPAGTVYVVVDGGTSNDIARRIFDSKTAAIPTYGTESIIVKDSKGYPHTIKFSRSSRKEIFMKGTFKRRAGSNISGTDAAGTLVEAAVEYLNSLQPGQSVVWSSLFGPLMSSIPNIEIDSLYIGFTGSSMGISTLELDIDKRAYGISSNITFTDITV